MASQNPANIIQPIGVNIKNKNVRDNINNIENRNNKGLFFKPLNRISLLLIN